ncbi:MAG TPA: hypothetical protein DC038_04410 [Clostridiales bacterium]|nr:hypothetical protein [Clostridiales bacterium]
MNNCKKMLSKIFIIGVFFIVGFYLPVEAAVSLTQEEEMYLAGQDALEAVTIGGVAPIQYMASSEEIYKITPGMIMRAYGKEIILVSLLALSVLLYSFISYIRINKKLRIQNRRHERLAQISNEYLYEYSPKDDRLELSDKCVRLFGMQEVFYKVSDIMKSILSGDISDGYISMIRLPLADGGEGIFKAVNSIVRDDYGRVDSIMGKLIDISKEVAEKEELLMKSQIDGLTGLYNATTTRELIVDRIRSKEKHKMDALILLDCDNFKNINDTLGHLTGNQVLEDLGRSLKITFRSTDIIGRIGGDEFCIYMKDVPSAEFIHAKCEQLGTLVKKIMEKELVSVSIGVAIVNEERSYEDLFKMADDNMYTAKRRGRDQL